MRGLVLYKLAAYKKTKCSKSIPGFSISRLAYVEDFFNADIFFVYKYVRINGYSFEYVCIVCCLKFTVCLLIVCCLLHHLFCNIEFEFS